jgi:multiple sugar transport system permease protein
MNTSTVDKYLHPSEERKNKILRLTRKLGGNLFTYVIYALIAVVFVVPLIYVLGNSFRDSQQIWGNAYPLSWKTFIPFQGISLENYKTSLGLSVLGAGQGMNISQNLLISALSAVVVVTCSLIFNTSAAYFFGRLKFPGKKYLLVFVVATMMVPRQIVLVPLYLVVDSLGLINTFWALVVPWYASPVIIFLLTQFMSDLPYDFDEAAIIDGANYWQILWHIIIPNVIPGIITVSIMEFQNIWNEFYWPLIAISNPKLAPIQIAIATQFTENSPNWGLVFSAMVLASAPVIILFFFLQRYFFESVAMSGVKG